MQLKLRLPEGRLQLRRPEGRPKPHRAEARKDVTSVGLDIGSSAVRAAEVSSDRHGRHLRRYAQVGLPAGAVVDGEIVNVEVVSEALKRLWVEGGFSTNKVVLGASGHRVIVRQAEVPALDSEDLRSALRFDAQELIPIPMDHASFDFRVLDRSQSKDEKGRSTARILLVAAHRDLLRYHLSAVKGAGLEAVAIDAVPLALMRVVPAPGGPVDGAPEGVVAIGSEMTTVAVRLGTVPLFIRSLAVGGSKLTAGIADALRVDVPVAERIKRTGLANGTGTLTSATRALTTELRDLGEEVRATIDFFVSQADGLTVRRLLLTGGASQTRGLADALADGSALTIEHIDPFAGLQTDNVGLRQEDLERARATAATAIGLALWPMDEPDARLSVLPDEVAEARRNRRMTSVAAAGVAGVAAVLALATGAEILNVRHAQDQVRSAQQQAATAQAQVTHLQSETAAHDQVGSRESLVATVLTGDIDWVKTIDGVAAVTPRSLSITSYTATRTVATSGSSSGSSGTSSGAASSGIGTVSFNVTGTGGLPAVADWINGLARDPDLQDVWVSGISTSNGGQVTFSSTANLTKNAQSNRAAEVKQ